MRIIITALLLLYFTCASAQSILEVTFKDLKTGTAYLWNPDGAQVDTIPIVNHRLSFTAALEEPTLFYLKVDNFNAFDYPIRLILSSEKTVLRYETLKPVIRDERWQDLYPNQPLYLSDPNHNYLLREMEAEWLLFSDSVISLTTDDADDEVLLEKRKNLYQAYIAHTSRKIADHADKVSSAVSLHEFLIRNGLLDLEQVKALYARFTESVQYGAAGIKIGTHLNKEVGLEIGKKAPYFEFKDFRGDHYTLTGFKGRKVLLHFWSSTCGPCRQENPEIAMFQKAHNSKLVIVNISLDANTDKWVNAMREDGIIDMINTCDFKGTAGKMVADYYVHGIPGYYLIGEDQMISAKGTFTEVREKLGE